MGLWRVEGGMGGKSRWKKQKPNGNLKESGQSVVFYVGSIKGSLYVIYAAPINLNALQLTNFSPKNFFEKFIRFQMNSLRG